VLIVALVRDRSGPGTDDEHWPGFTQIKRSLLSMPVLSVATAGGFVASAGVGFGMLWGVAYFQTYHHLSLSAASVCASFYFWGCLPGMLGFAWLCSRYERPALLLALGAVGTAIAMALMLFVLRGQVAQSAAMFLLGVFNSSYALCFTMVKDRVPAQLSGTAMGLTNMTIMGIGGLIFQPLLGALAHSRGQHAPDATSLSVIILAQVLALAILAGEALRTRAGTQADAMPVS